MDRLIFRIKGLTKGKVKRLRRLPKPPGNLPFGLSGKALVLWTLALVVAYALLGPPSVKIGDKDGVWIKANRVLVLVDTSGSMNSYVVRKDEALAKLNAAGISTEDQVSIGGSASDILGTIIRELAKRPKVEAIWMVSDFFDGSDLVNGNDRQRYEQLLRLLRRRGIKLYLSTVARTPPPDHIEAVRASGGDWGQF